MVGTIGSSIIAFMTTVAMVLVTPGPAIELAPVDAPTSAAGPVSPAADTAEAVAGGRFFDDDNNIHESSIEAIATEGITLGCNPPQNTGYCPDSSVTRGQMAAFLSRALELAPASNEPFSDTTDSIFADDVNRLASAGITRGCNPPANTLFCPEQAVTRGQMAAFLTRALELTEDTVGDRFSDDDDSVFEADIQRLASAGITVGCNPPQNDSFCPTRAVTRAEMATFLTRGLDLATSPVPERPSTTTGTDLDFVRNVIDQCGPPSGVFSCTIEPISVSGSFYFLEGWTYASWNQATPAEQAGFLDDRTRLEAWLDDRPITLVERSVTVDAGTAFKGYSFQFPAWLEGDHQLTVRFTSEPTNEVADIVIPLETTGTGYPG